MRHYKVLGVSNQQKLYELKIILTNEKETFKLGEQVYYGYPLEHSGRIEGILTPSTFLSFPDVKLSNYEFIRKNVAASHL